MKKYYVLMLAGIMTLGLMSCSEDAPVNPGGNQQNNQEMGTLQKLAQEWTLTETFENGQQKTSNGSTQYLFSRDGAFFFLNNNEWMALGSYTWIDSDSSAISMLLTGMNQPMIWNFQTLSEDELNTEFTTNGKTFVYHYDR